jgi:hypothetical protein
MNALCLLNSLPLLALLPLPNTLTVLLTVGVMGKGCWAGAAAVSPMLASAACAAAPPAAALAAG